MWDFGTDKANGVIKSVALTSQYFGNSAFENMGNEGKLFADPSNITAQFSETTQFFHARGQYIGTFRTGSICISHTMEIRSRS